MFKWTVRIVGGSSVVGVPYNVSTGPGSRDNPVIGNTPKEAAIDFFKKIKRNPRDGGWGDQEEIAIEVHWVTENAPDEKNGKFHNYHAVSNSKYIEVK